MCFEIKNEGNQMLKVNSFDEYYDNDLLNDFSVQIF